MKHIKKQNYKAVHVYLNVSNMEYSKEKLGREPTPKDILEGYLRDLSRMK